MLWCYVCDRNKPSELDLYSWGDVPKGNEMVYGYAKRCLCFITVHVPEVEMSIPDAMSQAPRALLTPKLEAVEWTDFTLL